MSQINIYIGQQDILPSAIINIILQYDSINNIFYSIVIYQNILS